MSAVVTDFPNLSHLKKTVYITLYRIILTKILLAFWHVYYNFNIKIYFFLVTDVVRMVPKIKILHIFCITLLLDQCLFSQGELFTAISEVEPLLETHKKIIDDLDDYVKKEETRLRVLKMYVFVDESIERIMNKIKALCCGHA